MVSFVSSSYHPPRSPCGPSIPFPPIDGMIWNMPSCILFEEDVRSHVEYVRRPLWICVANQMERINYWDRRGKVVSVEIPWEQDRINSKNRSPETRNLLWECGIVLL